MNKEKSAGAVVFYGFDPRLYLLLHYSKGHWDFPKGHVEKNESDLEAMLRELKEETGISDVVVIPGFRETISYFFSENGRKVSKTVTLFLVKSKTQNVVLSSEHVGYAWLPYEEALKKITFKNAAEVLKKANDFLKQKRLFET
ncbi:MAG: bis(5'-nucleosyl)-tetraphosphatase [Candidatus Diapherotrites archaeon]